MLTVSLHCVLRRFEKPQNELRCFKLAAMGVISLSWPSGIQKMWATNGYKDNQVQYGDTLRRFKETNQEVTMLVLE